MITTFSLFRRISNSNTRRISQQTNLKKVWKVTYMPKCFTHFVACCNDIIPTMPPTSKMTFGWLQKTFKWWLLSIFHPTLILGVTWMEVALDDVENWLFEVFRTFQYKNILKYAIVVYLGNLKLLALDLHFFYLSPTNEMKVMYSSFYSNLKFWKILQIEYFIAIWILVIFPMSSVFYI